MIKKYIHIFFFALAGLLYSCSDSEMNKIHQEYIDMKEKVYLGKTDSLKFFPGKERAKLTWYLTADPKVSETVIYWNNRQNFVTKKVEKTLAGPEKDSIIIEGLSVGTHLFELVNKSDDGETSLYTEIQGKVYADSYAEIYSPRTVASSTFSSFNEETHSGSVTLTWNEASEDLLGTLVRYKDFISGQYIEIVVPNESSSTELSNIGNRFGNPDDLISISSMVIPDSLSIDTFYTSIANEQILSYKTSNALRRSYLPTGQISGQGRFNNKVKEIRKESEFIYSLALVADYPIVAGSYLRLTINPDNSVTPSGDYSGTVTDSDNPCSFNPETGQFLLEYKILKSGGGYDVVTETLTLR